MSLFVKDIMEKQFDSIADEALMEEAVRRIFHGKIRKTGHKTISLMVTDNLKQLVGVITMFDILYHIRPTYLNLDMEGVSLPWEGKIKHLTQELKAKKVKQVMSHNIISAKPEEHLMTVLDRMIKNKYRRLPVIESGKPIGIVYISDIYYYLFKD